MKDFFCTILAFLINIKFGMIISVVLITLLIITGDYLYAGLYSILFICNLVNHVKEMMEYRRKKRRSCNVTLLEMEISTGKT